MRHDAPTLHRTGRTAAAAAALAFASLAAAQTILYVSPGGRDEWSGTMRYATRNRTDGPKKTIAGARDAIRLLKSQGRLDPKGAIVYLASGTYPITSTIVFDSRDSGTPEGPIVYRAQVQGKAILDGGRKLTNWTSVSPSVAAYLKPEVRNKVMQCRLGQLRITRAMVGEMIRRGWSEGAGWPPPSLLSFDGKMMPLAGTNDDGSWLLTPADQVSTDRTHFKTSYARAKSYSFDSDLWVHGYLGQEWADDTVKVTSIDPSTGMVTLAEQTSYALNPNARYRFINVLEELDTPGEWYLDRRTMTVFFFPPVRSQVGTKTSLATLTATMIKIDPTSAVAMHLKFEGLVFANSRAGNLVEANHSPSSVGFFGCTFKNAAGNGVNSGYGDPRNWTFDSCDFTELGGRGIFLYGGERPTLTPSGHLIYNCRFWDLSKLAKTCRPAIDLSGAGSTVRNCSFENLPHQAVQVSGNDFVIEWCLFDRVVREVVDGGAIYGGRDWTQRGTIVRNCVFKDIVRPQIASGNANGANGVFLDDGLSGWTIDSNLFQNVYWGVHMNGSRDVKLTNNVFYANSKAVVMGDWLVTLPDDHPGYQTILTRLASMPYTNALWSSRYPELPNILGSEPKAMRNNLSAQNVFYSSTVAISYGGNPTPNPPAYVRTATTSLFRQSEYEGNSPGFANFPASLDVIPGSGAAQAGFQPWDVSKVGTVDSHWR